MNTQPEVPFRSSPIPLEGADQPRPAGVPTMGRVVLFKSQTSVEEPALVMGWQEDNVDRGGTIGLTVFTSSGTRVEFAPGLSGKEDAGGRKWRFPPRVG